VIAPATIEECFHSMITARRLAEAFRAVVMVLTDANLATGVQPFPRPELDPAWHAGPPTRAPGAGGACGPTTGTRRPASRGASSPGQPGGMHT
jgi:2-oxoglutarate/2-oxoacid ferredoxin oxidoreductase subunit alpha